VVLSRELSGEEIRYICAHSPIEIEIFAHGALCMSYSGQCYMSAMIGGRSGNRGRCAQPCRQSYGYSHWENRYPMSLKDNCLVHQLQALEDMGVASLKLEGRMKRPEYVAAVTSVYRKALDEGVVTREMANTLLSAFNRQGFTDGYYTGRTGKAMFGIRDDKSEDSAFLKQMRKTYEGVEAGLVPVEFHAKITADASELTVTDPDGRSVTVKGAVPEPAHRLPLSEELFVARISKTGGTPYRCENATARVEPNLMMSAAAINALRREALDQLTAMRARREAPVLGKPRRIPHASGFRSHPAFTVQVTTAEQITGKLLKMNPSMLYVPMHILLADPKRCRDLTRRVAVAAVLPRICPDSELEKLTADLRILRSCGIRDVLVGNLGLMIPAREAGMLIHGDFGLNLYNSGAMQTAKDLELASATLSFEMTLPQIRDVSKPVPTEIFAYGRLPLMITENCLIRGRNGDCSCHMGTARLMDKTGADFPVIRDGNSCRSVLLNGKKLYWLDRQDDLTGLGLWAMRLYFTTENPKEVDQILSCCQNPTPFDPGASTRGLYLRGLD
jgi:putative protease